MLKNEGSPCNCPMCNILVLFSHGGIESSFPEIKIQGAYGVSGEAVSLFRKTFHFLSRTPPLKRVALNDGPSEKKQSLSGKGQKIFEFLQKEGRSSSITTGDRKSRNKDDDIRFFPKVFPRNFSPGINGLVGYVKTLGAQ